MANCGNGSGPFPFARSIYHTGTPCTQPPNWADAPSICGDPIDSLMPRKVVITFQTKRRDKKKCKGTTVAYKRIQGGIQSDITLRVTSNFSWYISFLSLHPIDSPNTNDQQLPFRVEKLHGTRSWMVCRKGCFVRSWHHKRYTSVRVQFFKHYCGRRLKFKMQIGNMSADTTTPIVAYNVFGMDQDVNPEKPLRDNEEQVTEHKDQDISFDSGVYPHPVTKTNVFEEENRKKFQYDSKNQEVSPPLRPLSAQDKREKSPSTVTERKHPLVTMSLNPETKRPDQKVETAAATIPQLKTIPDTPLPFTAQTLMPPDVNKMLQQRLARLGSRFVPMSYPRAGWNLLGEKISPISPLGQDPIGEAVTEQTGANKFTPDQSNFHIANHGVAMRATTSSMGAATSRSLHMLLNAKENSRARAAGAMRHVLGGNGVLLPSSICRWMMEKAFPAPAPSDTKSPMYTHPLVEAAAFQRPKKLKELEEQTRRQNKRKRPALAITTAE